jgi:hypothetical protein
MVGVDTGYRNDGPTWVSNGMGSLEIPASYEKRIGFDDPAGLANYMVKISNVSATTVGFEIQVNEAIMGGVADYGTAVSIPLGSPTWIGAKQMKFDFVFTAGGTTATVVLTDLTAGVDLEAFNSNGSSSVFAKTTDGTEDQTSKTVNVTGLTNGQVHVIRLYSKAFASSAASIGKMTITSP